MLWHIKTFKELTLEELYKIIQQRINVFVVEQNCPYPECDGKDLTAYHLYATEQGEIAAYVRILPPGVSYQEASIGRVIVHRDYRRGGLGLKLMKRAMDFITLEMKESAIRISAQAHLQGFYGRLGFKPASEIYQEDGIPHIEMVFING